MSRGTLPGGLARTAVVRIRTVATDERGVSLVLALVMIAALSLATASLSSLVVSNAKSFGRDSQEARSFNVAEAGLNYAVSRLTTYDPNGSVAVNSTIGSTESPQAFTLDGGAGNGGWWAEKTGTNVWTVHARAVSPNGSVKREVAVETTTDTVLTNIQASAAWGYGLFISSPSGCTTVVGNALVTMPVFVKSDLCLQGSSGIAEPSSSGTKKVTLYVGGKLTTTGSAKVGTASRKIISATVVGGCNGGTASICSNSSFSKVYADAYYSAPTSLTKPPLDVAGTYDSGDWDHPVCSTGGFTFDNDGARNASVNTSTLYGSSYDCTVKDPTGTTVVGRLAWNNTTHALTVSGILFIDGNLHLSGGAQASYTGTAALYVNGSMQTNGNSALCGPGATLAGSSCNGLWNSTLGALGIVALNGWTMTGTAEYNVISYVVGNYDDGGSAKVTGPIITDTAKLHGTPDTTDLTDPPPGLPGAAGFTSTTTWSVAHGTWRQVPATG